MGTQSLAALLVATTLSGCWGYNSSAKGWSYVGDAVLIAGGGLAIGLDQATKPEACTGTGCPTFTSPVGGGLILGAALVTAGVIGILFNATRTEVRAAHP